VNAMARRVILHEMGHIWLDENLRPSIKERFLEMRGLRAWNAGSDPWGLRGYEQGAEMMAWALGERILTPQIPNNDPIDIANGFRLLTGIEPPDFVEPEHDSLPSTHKGVPSTSGERVAAMSPAPSKPHRRPPVDQRARARACGRRPSLCRQAIRDQPGASKDV
jgi:hypothetical protein